MKKNYFLIALVGAFLFSACEKENIDPMAEDQAQSQIEESALKGAKKHMVPFKARFNVQTVGTPTGEPPILGIVCLGTGNATHLGKTKIQIDEQYNLITNEAVDFVTLTAANGDQLFINATGIVTPTSDPNIQEGNGPGIFAGGTGRFEDAEGSLVAHVVLDFTNFPVVTSKVLYTGEIKY